MGVAQKFVDVPQVQYVDNHIHIPIQKHRHVPMIQKIQKPVEVPVLETVEKIVDVPVIKQVEVPQIQTIERHGEVPYVQTVEKVVEIPQIGENLSGQTRSRTTTLQPVRQQAPAEVVNVVEQGPPLPAEKTTAVVEVAQIPLQTVPAPVATVGMVNAFDSEMVAAPVLTSSAAPVVTSAPMISTAAPVISTAAPVISTAAPVMTAAPIITGSASIAPANMVMPGTFTTGYAGGYTTAATDLFTQIDTNHDGKIDRAELSQWRFN